MWDRLSRLASLAMMYAQDEASMRGEKTIALEHLLLGITQRRGAAVFMLESVGVDVEQTRKAIYDLLPPFSTTELAENMRVAPEVVQVIQAAIQEADTASHNYIGTEHLLLGIMRLDGSSVAQLLTQQGATYENLHSCYCGLLQ